MRLLNGTKYYTRTDLKDILLLCKQIVKNPYSYPKLDFIHTLDDEERGCILFGMESLFNIFAWEFATEHALNFEKIKQLRSTLEIHESEKLDFDSYQLLSPPAITERVLKQFENWLNFIGQEILINEIKNS